MGISENILVLVAIISRSEITLDLVRKLYVPDGAMFRFV